MKNWPTLFGLLLLPQIISAQHTINQLQDSVNFHLTEIENTQLSWQVRERHADKALLYTQKLADSSKYTTNIKVALLYFRQRKLDSLKKYSFIAHDYAYALNDSLKIQKAHFYLATYYKYKEIPDSAYYHYDQSKNVLLQLKDSVTAGRRMLNIAVLQLHQKDLLGSEITTIKSLEYLEKSNLHKIKADLYNNLGLIARERREFDESLKYFTLSLETLKKGKSRYISSELNAISNIGALYSTFGQHKKSLEYKKIGLSYKNIEKKYPNNYASLLEAKARSTFILGDSKNVLNDYLKALKIREQNNNLKQASLTHINIAEYYIKQKDFNNAKKHARAALIYSKKTKENTKTLNALQLLARLTTGNESKQYLQEYIHLSDSLYLRERTLKNQFAKIRYETDKKEQENETLKSENEKQQAQLERERLQKLIGYLISGGALSTLVLSILFFRNRKKRLLYQAQLEKAEAREKERQQIAKALHDEVAGDLRMLHQKLAQQQQHDIAQNLDTIKNNVRNLSHQLSSVSFDEVTFKDQLINLVSDYFSPKFRIMVHGIDTIDWKYVDKNIKRALFLSIRESLQNSKKHANASKINVNFSLEKKEIHLSIKDNGSGFDSTVVRKGIGLKNQKERVEELNGNFSISSELNQGTQTYIQIPLNA